MPNSPPTSLLTINLTNSLLTNNVHLRLQEKEQCIGLAGVDPIIADLSSQCSSSQLAEGRCSVFASGASSLEKIAVEKSKIMPLGKLSKVIEASASHFYLTVFGTVTFGLAALASISIVAIATGSDISLKVPIGSESQIVEFETNSNREATR